MDKLLWLSAVKERTLLRLPSRPETFNEMVGRASAPRRKCETAGHFYYDLTRHYARWVVLRLPFHVFWKRGEDVFLSWMVPDEGGGPAGYFALRLTEAEAQKFAALFRVLGMKVADGVTVTERGFGPFPLGALRRDESFVDGLGRVGVVFTDDDGGMVAVMMNPHSITASRLLLPRSANVWVEDAAKADVIRKRLATPSLKVI